jgi:nucleotide-binding universal stress UspA family protein
MSAVLVPVDGSKNALRALDYAVQQARRLKMKVHLLNVQLPPVTYGVVPAYLNSQEYREMAAQHAQAILKPAAGRVRRAHVACMTHVVYDEIAPAIVRTARRLGCDWIVMGTRGLGAIGNLLLGSIATKVIHLARTPVTLVK